MEAKLREREKRQNVNGTGRQTTEKVVTSAATLLLLLLFFRRCFLVR
jgi:hypothetical protein